MKYANRLFRTRKGKIYRGDTDRLFFLAMRENCVCQYDRNPEYRRLLEAKGFDPRRDLNGYEDLAAIPFLPTLYFKRHDLRTKRRTLVEATSSGTSGGTRSRVGFSVPDLWRMWQMVRRVCSYHRLWSLRPTHYVVFGFEPNRSNKTAIARTSFGATLFSPALSRDYALRWQNGAYRLDLERVKQKLIRYSRSRFPVRTVGFPAYTYFLLKEMKEQGISLQLPRGSLVMLGGGWKQFYAEEVSKEKFYQLVREVLGVDDAHVVEFFGAVEHPILYTDCRCHHFHIPAYGRVIIRDPDTLEPVAPDRVGLIDLLTPAVSAMPLLSVMTDDLGRVHTEPCPCGEPSPWLEILGRVGIRDVVTCAQGASEFLKGTGEGK